MRLDHTETIAIATLLIFLAGILRAGAAGWDGPGWYALYRGEQARGPFAGEKDCKAYIVKPENDDLFGPPECEYFQKYQDCHEQNVC